MSDVGMSDARGDAGMSDAGTSGPSPFRASRGWFDRSKKRYGLHNVKLTGEHASADHEAAETFPAQLTQLIEDNGYVPEQVFNADETGLFWGKINAHKNFQLEAREDLEASWFKAAKDRVFLRLCANAKGDCMIKLMMLYHSLNNMLSRSKIRTLCPYFGWPTERCR